MMFWEIFLCWNIHLLTDGANKFLKSVYVFFFFNLDWSYHIKYKVTQYRKTTEVNFKINLYSRQL